ncbi:hypothetical protein LCGC14_0838130 [marine sediment metagenome]|uniref:Uncharacterized protein n=1 Tax=marine sediment metagenome TaxID=412755 RepID=A0A0F9PE00_9ZZZZ
MAKKTLPSDPKLRFKEQATSRVNTAIYQIDLVGKLASSSNSYTEEQILAIEKALGNAAVAAVKTLRDYLKGVRPSQSTGFKL